MTHDDMRQDMIAALTELLGTGYVDEYYESLAIDFIEIAEAYAQDTATRVRREIRGIER